MDRNLLRFIPIALALLFALFKLLTSPTFVNPETGRKAHVGLSPQQEQTLGLQSYEQVRAQAGPNLVESGPAYGAIQRIAQHLEGAAAEKSQTRYNWKLSLVRSGQVNAFCLPGGEIVVYTGILPVARTAGGLAVVLGHEMAHATSRHGAQRLFQQNIAQTILSGAQFSLLNMDYYHQRAVMGALGAATQYGAILPFSREHESEADHIGLIYMARAGYDPRQAVAFWEQMQRQAGSGQPPEFASDHPSHGRRVEQLQAWMPEAIKEYESARQLPPGEQQEPLGGDGPAADRGVPSDPRMGRRTGPGENPPARPGETRDDPFSDPRSVRPPGAGQNPPPRPGETRDDPFSDPRSVRPPGE